MMGMFDYINYEADCPKCGHTIKTWQSKDAECELDVIEPWRVERFYGICKGCGVWVDAKVDAEIEHIVKRCDITLHVDDAEQP
jgi:hypothetical protein